jgi:hypothetical protein
MTLTTSLKTKTQPFQIQDNNLTRSVSTHCILEPKNGDRMAAKGRQNRKKKKILIPILQRDG